MTRSVEMIKDMVLNREDNGNKRWKRIAEVLSMYIIFQTIGNDIKNVVQKRHNAKYHVAISLHDNLINVIAKEITARMVHGKKHRNIQTTAEGFTIDLRPGFLNEFVLEGRKYTFIVDQEKGAAKKIDEDGYAENFGSPRYLRIGCITESDFKYLQEWLETLRVEMYKRPFTPNIYISNSWNDWNRVDVAPTRKMESVFLKKGQTERIINDIENFMTSKEQYISHGIPYHRGYLFYGPPGTGKSSLFSALAHHFNKHICFMPLHAMKSDQGILSLFSYVPKNALLIIEDIDSSRAVQSRDKDDNAVVKIESERTTLSTMLNSLDGITTPDGLIVMMSTNKLDVIDPAIMRPGRIDVIENIDYIDNYQLENMVSFFLERPYTTDIDVYSLQITPAQVIEIMKSNLNSRDKIIPQLEELLRNRNGDRRIVDAVLEAKRLEK